MILLRLFWEFLKIGMFSVGGGMATLPFLYDLADNTGWYTYAQLADMLAVSESTPGPVGINMATYVGYTVGGFPAALIATLGVVLPGVILVLVIAMFWPNSAATAMWKPPSTACARPPRRSSRPPESRWWRYPCSMSASLKRPAYSLLDLISIPAIILALVIWLLTNVVKPTKKLHPVVFIAASAVVGIVFSFGGA